MGVPSTPPQEPSPDNVLEIKDGVWDPVFTAITGAVALALIVAEIAFAFELGKVFHLGDVPVTIGEKEVPNGTFGERFLAHLTLFGITIGVGVLTIGSWLAALELRARLTMTLTVRKPPTPGNSLLFGGIGVKEVGEAIGAVAEKFSKVRGTVAVVVAGMVIVLGSLTAGAAIVVSDNGNAGGDGTEQTGGAGSDNADSGTDGAADDDSGADPGASNGDE